MNVDFTECDIPAPEANFNLPEISKTAAKVLEIVKELKPDFDQNSKLDRKGYFRLLEDIVSDSKILGKMEFRSGWRELRKEIKRFSLTSL